MREKLTAREIIKSCIHFQYQSRVTQRLKAEIQKAAEAAK